MAAIAICSSVASAGAGGGVHRHPIIGRNSPTGGWNSHESTAERGMHTPKLGSHSSSSSQSSPCSHGRRSGTHAPPMHASSLSQQSSRRSPQSCSGSAHCATHDPSKHISEPSQHWPLHAGRSPQSLTQAPSWHASSAPQHRAIPPNTQAGTSPHADTHVPSATQISPLGQSQSKSLVPEPAMPPDPPLPVRGAETFGVSPHPANEAMISQSQARPPIIRF